MNKEDVLNELRVLMSHAQSIYDEVNSYEALAILIFEALYEEEVEEVVEQLNYMTGRSDEFN